MRLGKEGEKLIKSFEGCRLKSYKCPAGKWTIGWGHTAGVKPFQTITQEQADQYFLEDIKVYENHVNRIVKHKLTQNQFDALVSFCYNCGPGNLQKLVNGRDLEQISIAILLYNKGGGRVLPGLERRRQEERRLFVKGMEASPYTKYQVTASGLNVRVGIGTSYKIVDVLSKNQIVEVTETSNGWGKISNGWISLKYTKQLS